MSERTAAGKVITGSPLAVVATLLFAACTDPVTSIPQPTFSFSPNGITLGPFNGTMAQSGDTLIKGFNPTNPHHGDAIIATFYWLGSTNTNIIDSVTDGLTMPGRPRVGNKYTLVDYVTAGGLSMATYVATNVQNFPDAYNKPAQDSILAVQAWLSQSISDGGVTISAWTGVEDITALALGEHKFASGTDTGSIPARAGPIAVDAGGLVYTVTMGKLQSGAFTGLSLPEGFTSIGRGSDDFILNDAAYQVRASAGTADPQWTWLYGAPARPWLVTTLVLRAAPPPPPPTGDLTATTSTSGPELDLDPDGYIVTVDGATSKDIGINGSVPFPGLTAGDHSVELSGLAANCTVDGANPQTVNVPAGGTATAPFTVTCAPTTGDVPVTTTSSGADIPASYTMTLDGGDTKTIASNGGSETYTRVSPGSHTVFLTVPSNCTVSGGPSRTVTVTAGEATPVPYSVDCNAPPAVNAGPDETALTGLLYTLQWSFTDANHNGSWQYKINWGDGTTSSGTVSSEGNHSNGHTYVVLLPKTFTVTVTVTDAAGAQGSDTKNVTVLLL